MGLKIFEGSVAKATVNGEGSVAADEGGTMSSRFHLEEGRDMSSRTN